MATTANKKLNGSQSKDDNHIAISTAAFFQTLDATGTPQKSPLSVPIFSGSFVTLAVPLNATEIVLYASAAMRVSEDSAFAQYFTLPATTVLVLPCSKMANIYVGGDAGTVTLQFAFKTLGS